MGAQVAALMAIRIALVAALLCAAPWGCSDDAVQVHDSGLTPDLTPDQAAGDKTVGIEIGTTKPDLEPPPKPDKGTPPKPDKGTPPDQGTPVADALPSVCKPFCDKIGSYSEGWYDSCTKIVITKVQCSGCNAVCKDCGSGCKSNGWYDSCKGKLIQYTSCTECKPVCGNIGSKSEGWVDGCKGGLLKKPGSTNPYWDQCAKCKAVCKNFGTYSMGYYSSCNSLLIQYGTCIP